MDGSPTLIDHYCSVSSLYFTQKVNFLHKIFLCLADPLQKKPLCFNKKSDKKVYNLQDSDQKMIKFELMYIIIN
jgi:hypothetical protein